jgi:hypothetical protein
VGLGYKGKGSTLHVLTNGWSQPLKVRVTSAMADERKQVCGLIDQMSHLLPHRKIICIEADKGYDSRELRIQLLMRGLYPLIPYRGK